MKQLFRQFLAACRRVWLGWLRLVALPWRWLALLLGLSRPADPASAPEAATDTPPEMPPQAAQAAKRSVEPALLAEDEDESGRSARAVVVEAAPTPKAEPLAPAAEPVEPGAFTEGMFRNDAGQRSYKLYIPAGKANGKLPLVVMLHGCKQDPDDFAAGTRMNRLADSQHLAVLYPAQARSANGFGCWNWFNRHDQQRGAGEPSIIAGMIQEVITKHAVDPRRVYVAGLSAGGAMALILARTYPELLAAAGVHSGLAHAVAQDMITAMGVMKRGPGRRATAAPAKRRGKGAETETEAEASVPLIVFHGDHDETVHPLNGEQVIEQALAATPAAQTKEGAGIVVEQGKVPGGRAYTRTLHSNGAARAHAEHWLVHGAGHAWSGGDSRGSFTDPLGPDASNEMLRFFLERTKV